MALYSCKISTACGSTCLQTDDTVSAGNGQITSFKSKMSTRFPCKVSALFEERSHVQFSSTKARLSYDIYAISHLEHISKLDYISE